MKPENPPARQLLIFGKYPRPGLVKTRLIPPLTPQLAADLYRAFLLDMVQVFSGLSPWADLLLYTAHPGDVKDMQKLLGDELPEPAPAIHVRAQHGSGLGQRLHNAFAERFAGGARAVGIIGADHPTLPVDYVRRGIQALDQHDCVIGPGHDGGYYFIGLTEPHPELFTGITFSTDTTCAQTLQAAQTAGLNPYLLRPWYDVDDATSLRRLMTEGAEGRPRTAAMLTEIRF